MKCRSIASVISKSAMTPSFNGRIATILPGRAAEHALGLVADGEHLVGADLHGDDRRLAQDDAVVLDINQRVGRS